MSNMVHNTVFDEYIENRMSKYVIHKKYKEKYVGLKLYFSLCMFVIDANLACNLMDLFK